jgi:hypothetical protein
MKHKRRSTNLLIFVVNLLVVALIATFQVSAQETYPRKTLKHATKEADNPQKFLSFIKEREYTDSPYEIASPESEQLLKFIEGTLLAKETSANAERQREWTKEFIAYLREGHGEFLMVSDGVYIVYSYFLNASLSGFWLADTTNSVFKQFTTGYDIEIVDKGLLADGTGWLLCRHGGLSHGKATFGFKLITYITIDGRTKVQNTDLVSEVIGYTEDETKRGSLEYYCGKAEDRIRGIAGEITGYSWERVGGGGAKKIQFSVIERNCDNFRSKNTKRKIAFIISKGNVSHVKTK